MKKSHQFTALLMTTVFGFGQMAFAQKVETTADGSTVTYEKDFFTNYNAVTLLDMLLIIPGGKEILDKNSNQYSGGAEGQGERGFGSGGDQILMNGKRLAGKSNNIEDTLSRISAEQVERVEIIRGVADGLDVQSQGLIINVVMQEGGSNATTFWKVSALKTFSRDTKPEFTLSRSGSVSGLDYNVSIERSDSGYFYNRDETAFNSTGDVTSEQNVDAGFAWDSFIFNTNLGYQFADGSQLQLNGLYSPGGNDGYEIRNKTTNALNPVSRLIDGSSDEWEIGGDYTKNLGVLGNFKALFVINGDDGSERVSVTKGSDADNFEATNETEVTSKSEKILRLSLNKGLTEKQSLEFGGEVAINTYDKSFVRNQRNAASEDFLLINSDEVMIKENRYEVFANHTYNISSNFVLQSSLVTEFSTIIADNVFAGGTPTRRDTSFTYFKPRFNLRYDISDQDQFRATAEQKVSQLDFGNFVTRYDQQAEVLRFGNPNIRPEQVWEFTAQYEHRLPNDGGSIAIEGFYRAYEDHITQVDFTEYQNLSGDVITADQFFTLPPTAGLRDMIDFTSKAGNIDRASSIGAKLNITKRLDFIGLPQAVFSTNYTYEKRRATDQFTGESIKFPFASDHTLTFNYRHDITDIGFAYGFSGEWKSDYEMRDINWHWPTNPNFKLEAFAEYIVMDGIKLAVQLENIMKNRSTSTFTFYNDHRRFNESFGHTDRKTTNWTELTISLQGTF
ncbi:TonB-dependent receptor plug domain-containing protein [Pseudemcibacter aquimaris]|uniref:TonB-dependent receptor plug domain-containing protein n=1 Tax=Pseudemcibacter aquimaris TaxID=2857064 RepID=UPI002011A8F1|nr:TonB-dependent receptor [Pseudemcibacter aquimaris]MCC3862169.1 TonB-dependent receptor plug domain-containing protein [Pseudemcibacter aquimaris]WDU58922.1 TonB-dependent receptor plug domain-containing protein [Pseudemcibacter aquimaris]